MSRKSWDLVVIGGGTAGMVTASQVARAGLTVALVEAERTGGECLYTGCVPSKSLLASARVANTIRRAGDFGIQTEQPNVDFAAVMQRKNDVIAEIEPHDSPEALAEAGVTVIQGKAHFVDSQTVRVGQDLHIGEQFVIATGSKPIVPDIPGLRSFRYLTSETIFDLTELPQRLAIIGAGFTALELGQAFSRFGSDVTIINRSTRILTRTDADLADRLQRRLEAEGITFLRETEVERVDTDSISDLPTLKLAHATGTTSDLEADLILVATGRQPNIDSLALENAGFPPNQTTLDLNDLLQTELEHIWACGDVTGPPNLTHRADDQARTLATNILGGASTWKGVTLPWAIFTDPPVAGIGLTHVDARARFGDRLEVLRFPFDRLDRAVIDGAGDGEIVVLLKPGWVGGRIGGEIAGVQIIGERADDLINQFAPFLTWRLPAGLLAKAVQVYPTYSLGARQAVGLHWRQHRFSPKPSARSRLRRWWRDWRE